MDQKSHSEVNRAAWSHPAYYDAWCKHYGAPRGVAAEIARDPWGQLRRYQPHLGQVDGKRVVNLLGSIGRKAVPLAMLGADVTVVDASPVNARYAEELADAAGVTITYVVSDVLQVEPRDLGEPFDILLTEGGVLHYFLDLRPFADLCHNLLRPGGHLILGEHHPMRKCTPTEYGRAVLSEDYFDGTIHECELPLAHLLSDDVRAELPSVRCRHWTLGEIVTTFAEAGFLIQALKETPGMFHLIAERGDSSCDVVQPDQGALGAGERTAGDEADGAGGEDAPDRTRRS
ncbi:MAG: methyltransferase domain-containing protein [Candidatus Brocadiaceae bacterium]|nr:methyltransferase domain-containing protein [Candidatus Brocadiaceae bacterium]